MPLARENACKSVNQQTALHTFATYSGTVQSQLHIKPLHHYVACRLVLEGDFFPTIYAASSLPSPQGRWLAAKL